MTRLIIGCSLCSSAAPCATHSEGTPQRRAASIARSKRAGATKCALAEDEWCTMRAKELGVTAARRETLGRRTGVAALVLLGRGASAACTDARRG